MIIGSVTLIILAIFILIIVLLAITAPIYLHLPRFGKFPSGERLERIRRSPNYRDGQFHNLVPTEIMTSKSFGKLLKTFNKMVFGKKSTLKPPFPLPMVKRDLQHLAPDDDGHARFGNGRNDNGGYCQDFLHGQDYTTISPCAKAVYRNWRFPKIFHYGESLYHRVACLMP